MDRPHRVSDPRDQPADVQQAPEVPGGDVRGAGREDPLFEQGAIDLAFQYSRGIPRVINTICNNCLLESHLQHKRVVTSSLVLSVCNNLLLGGRAQSEEG